MKKQTGLEILQEAIMQAWQKIKKMMVEALELYRNALSDIDKKEKQKRNWNLEIDSTIDPQVICRKPLFLNARSNP